MDTWEYQNKPCHLENRVFREPCKQRTACVVVLQIVWTIFLPLRKPKFILFTAMWPNLKIRPVLVHCTDSFEESTSIFFHIFLILSRVLGSAQEYVSVSKLEGRQGGSK